MLAPLLKTIKNIGLTQALSVTIVVQGVAVQQSTVSNFESEMGPLRELILEKSAEEKNANTASSNLSNESRDWQLLEELSSNRDSLAEDSAGALLAENLSELYREPAPQTQPQGPAALGSNSLVAVAAPATQLPSFTPASNSTSSEVRSREASPPTRSALAGANLVDPEKIKARAERQPSSQNVENETPSLSFEEAPVIPVAHAPALEPTEEAPEKEEPKPFTFLAEVALYEVTDDGVTFLTVIEDQMILTLDEDKEYAILVHADEDFGSVEMILSNLNESEIETQAEENQLPFSLDGDGGPDNTPRGREYEAAQYQLDLRAFDQNGKGGDILETRTLRFEVRHDD